MIKSIILTAIAASTGLAGAGVIVSYSYSDLSGAYDAQTGAFTAEAADDLLNQSTGDVSRLTDPPGTAQFNTGFLGQAFADVTISMTVSNVTATSATGAGSVTLADLNNDTITADFAGLWTIGPAGFMFFNGSTSNYAFTDNGSQDGVFAGTSGSFQISDLLGREYDGAISLLLRNADGFSGSFESLSTEADGVLIPAPGVLGLAGLGLLGASTRRRR